MKRERRNNPGGGAKPEQSKILTDQSEPNRSKSSPEKVAYQNPIGFFFKSNIPAEEENAFDP